MKSGLSYDDKKVVNGEITDKSTEQVKLYCKEMVKLFDKLVALHEEKGKAYGANGQVLNEIGDTLEYYFGPINKDIPLGELSFAMELLTKWLRYWKIHIVNGQKDNDDPLVDMMLYGAMILVGETDVPGRKKS